jgi:hypothetical protein
MDNIASRGRSSQFRSPESITDFEFEEEVAEHGGGNDSIEELGLEDCGGDDEQSSRSQN